MLIFTIACWNYLPKALCLADSIRKAGIDATLTLCLVESSRGLSAEVLQAYSQVLFAAELYENFDQFMFRHDALEGSTSIKARLFERLMKQYPGEQLFLYLDPDIWVFASFDELSTSLHLGEIFLTPHQLMNEASPEQVGDQVFASLRAGAFNLGFIALQRSHNATTFLNWWRDRIELWCYAEREKGLYVEQKWIDLLPGLMDVVVLRHPNYNIARWNIAQRHLKLEDGKYLVNGVPVRFIHFSGLTGRDAATIEQHLERVPADNHVRQLIPAYLAYLRCFGQEHYEKIPWSYGSFRSGEPILREARLAYRTNSALREAITNPFDGSNELILGANHKLVTQMIA